MLVRLHNSPESQESRCCWTFIFRGGQPFDVQVESRKGPGHQHNGQVSVWKFMGTESEAQAAEQALTQVPGLRVQRVTEVEDAEMLKERHRRLGLHTGDDDALL